MMKRAMMLSAAALIAQAVSAQAGDWSYNATLYAWVPGLDVKTDTPFGSVDSDKSPSEVLNALDMAFMGRFAARNDHWTFIADLLYADLSASRDSPFGKLFTSATFGTRLTAFSGYALYRVANQPKIQFDAGVGFRTFQLSFDTTLTGAAAPTFTRDTSTTWTDPLIAASIMVPINDQWFVNGFADYGGAGSGNETWQVYAGVGYRINEHWSTEAGYRYMDVSKKVGDRDEAADLGLSGALFGVTYSF